MLFSKLFSGLILSIRHLFLTSHESGLTAELILMLDPPRNSDVQAEGLGPDTMNHPSDLH